MKNVQILTTFTKYINFDWGKDSLLFGSMKEYWRQTENISINKTTAIINSINNSNGIDN